uniref:Caveolin n=1 Tax=Elaeophora elaphi TaxID=1147741 RepID=A0A0R3RV11_9BILA
MSSNVTVPTITHSLTSAVPFIIENFRNKRQLWLGYDYDSYYGYGFHWGRIILFILILTALFLCCLVPCICALGIWFAGWFGLRSQVANKGSISSPVPANTYTQQQPIIPQTTAAPQNSTLSGPGNSRECMDAYVYEEKRSDRYYHQPSSPRLHDDYQHFTSSKL